MQVRTLIFLWVVLIGASVGVVRHEHMVGLCGELGGGEGGGGGMGVGMVLLGFLS